MKNLVIMAVLIRFNDD